jgi:hypothetical protein
MSDAPGTVSASTRRAALAFGARCAAALAAIGLWSPASEAKRRKKKRKKKAPQVIARLVAANMTGAKEVAPITGDQNGSGSATFEIKSNGEICATFAQPTLTPESIILNIHIHRGGPAENGPVVVDFSQFLPALSGCTSASPAVLDEIRGNPSGFYANLHTDKFDRGAIRDQLQSA